MKEKAGILFAAMVVQGVLLGAAPTSSQYVKVVDFSAPDAYVRGGMGALAKSNGVEHAQLKDQGCVKFTYRDIDWFSLSLPRLADHLRASADPGRDTRIYIKYRAVGCKGTVSCRAITVHEGAEIAHQGRFPVFDNQDVSIAVMSLGLCWHRNKVAFNPKEIKNLAFNVTGGGELWLYEAGLFIDNTVERSPIDPAPWDEMAFRVFPEPKTFQRKDGAFAIGNVLRGDLAAVPPAARAGFEKELREFYGVKIAPGDDVVFRMGRAEGVRGDGFAIDVTPAKIVAESPTPSGLAYAVQTLQELIWRAGGKSLPCFRLVDSPRLDNRYILDYTWGGQNNLVYEPDFYNDVCARFVFPARYNLFSHDIASRCRWETEGAPVKPNGWTWSKADFAKVVDFANGHGVTVVPTTQSFGHQRPYFGLNRQFAERYCEDGDSYVMCTRNPDTLRCLLGIWDEAIAICSRNPAYRSKFFMMLGDEVRWQTDKVPPEKRCRRCAGVPRTEIFVEHIQRLRDEAAKRGLRLAMYDDMFNPCHNGNNEFKLGTVRDRVPADVIRVAWGGIGYLNFGEYAERGYEAWKLTTGAQTYVYGDDTAKGLGIGLTTWEWWRAFVTSGRAQGRYGLLGIRLMGGYAWGDAPHRNDELMTAAKKYGAFLMRGWSRKPFFGKEEALPLGGEVAVGKEAVKLTVRPGRVKGLVFTHGLELAGDAKEVQKYLCEGDFRKQLDCRGTRIVKVVAKYADGSEVEIPMFHGWNLGNVNSDGTKIDDVLSRYLADARRVIVDKEDRHVRHEYEWLNPHSEKEIESLSVVPTIANPLGVYHLYSLTRLLPNP